MKLVSIEPTPSPNTMKLNVDTVLPKGVQRTYTAAKGEQTPDYIQKLLHVPGVKSVFHTADFLAIDRIPQGNWQSILTQAREILGDLAKSPPLELDSTGDSWGEVSVLIQTFRGIPMQIRVQGGKEQTRIAMPDRFVDAAMKAGSASPTLLRERTLEEYGIRYGDLQEVAEQVAQELDAAYPQDRLALLVEHAIAQGENVTIMEKPLPLTAGEVAKYLGNPDWKQRYAALERLKPAEDNLPVLAKALHDEHTSIRRLAVVYFADIRNQQILPYLIRALKDPSPIVRRTAGDTLSDLGDPAAIQPMIEALKDPNKLVRWRAARFLYEVGDDSALGALRLAQDDAEFEVAMQVKIALERIEQGEAAKGTVWQQMTRRNDQ